jgi:hypothetical protein
LPPSTSTCWTGLSRLISTPSSRQTFGHDLSDRAHAADRVAPGALLAVDLAEHVVEQDVGAAGGVGAGVVADHRVEPERGLDRLALEPLAEEAGGRLGEQVEHVALLLEAELRQAPALQRAVEQRAPALADFRRGLEREAAEDFGDGLERVVVGGERSASRAENLRNSAWVRSSPPPSLR